MAATDDISRLLAELEQQAARDGIHQQAVGAAVAMNGGILLVKRAAHESFLANYWEIPGGGREAADGSLLAALQRELREETGLTIIRVQGYLGYFDYSTGPRQRVRQWNFIVSAGENSVTLNPHEHDDYRIIYHPDELPDRLLISPESRAVALRALLRLTLPLLRPHR